MHQSVCVELSLSCLKLKSTILDKKIMIMMIIIMRATPLFVLNSLYVGIHLFSGDDHKLCCKDLGGEVIKKLEGRLKNDETALKQIFQSFGIDRLRASTFSGILSMFPDTPVKLLKEVFEALQLYDLIDLLEEGKPQATRSLRPALCLQEIEKLRNPDDRPISYHSSVAVLIINYEKNSDTEGIEKFFKGLNNKSEVTVMHYRNFNEAVRIYPWSLRDEENITREINKLRLTSSEVIRSWISNQGW